MRHRSSSGGKLYGFHGRQETGQELRCIDPSDGKVSMEREDRNGLGDRRWRAVGHPHGEGGAHSRTGGSSGFRSGCTGSDPWVRRLARCPALSNGRLYARDGKNLVCVEFEQVARTAMLNLFTEHPFADPSALQ